MDRRKRLIALALVAGSALTACGPQRSGDAIEVSLIGDRPRLVDPDRTNFERNDAVLASATAMGLVGLDASGQVEPGLAESWIVTDDGLSTIFRLKQLNWPDGREVTGDDVANSLNRAIAPASRNRMKPLMSAVDTVVGMTGRVVEIRLHAPRPNLLQLLAQPEFGIRRDGAGLGPYRARPRPDRLTELHPAYGDDDPDAPSPPRGDRGRIDVRGERASLAITRFVAAKTDLVMGGTVADWPLVQATKLRPNRLHFDPVLGLFGLAFSGKGDFVRDVDMRTALAMAIDRQALAAALAAPDWSPIDHILPGQLDSVAPPTLPDWSAFSIDDRRANARQRIRAWVAGRDAPPVLKVALPPGPGMRIVFARIAADWLAIGVQAEAVPIADPGADLRLIDAVAPNNSANWYLTELSCAAGLVCDSDGDAALLASREAGSLAERAALISKADAILMKRASYIALGLPVRWALVDPRLNGWRDNALGVHPLSELRAADGPG